jgi:heme oxygenase
MLEAATRPKKQMVRGHAHERLRAATHPLHKLLDSRFDLATLSGQAGYSKLLLSNWPVVAIEQALEKAGIRRLLPDWLRRRRRAALVGDLRELGVPLPRLVEIPIAFDDGGLLGWSYVLEGSRLGAQMIAQAIDARPCEHIMRATRFLRHGTGKHFWDSFKSTLARIDGDAAAISNACAGAEAAFECFLTAALAPETPMAPPGTPTCCPS